MILLSNIKSIDVKIDGHLKEFKTSNGILGILNFNYKRNY